MLEVFFSSAIPTLLKIGELEKLKPTYLCNDSWEARRPTELEVSNTSYLTIDTYIDCIYGKEFIPKFTRVKNLKLNTHHFRPGTLTSSIQFLRLVETLHLVIFPKICNIYSKRISCIDEDNQCEYHFWNGLEDIISKFLQLQKIIVQVIRGKENSIGSRMINSLPNFWVEECKMEPVDSRCYDILVSYNVCIKPSYQQFWEISHLHLPNDLLKIISSYMNLQVNNVV
jgi:hypothetical protein